MSFGWLFAFLPDSVSELRAERRARRKAWNPIGARVRVIFDDTRDPDIRGYGTLGTVTACSIDSVRGTPSNLLVKLDHDMRCSFEGVTRLSIQWVVMQPCLRWRRTSRLAAGEWSAVRIVDAPTIYDARYDRTMGTGRVYLL